MSQKVAKKPTRPEVGDERIRNHRRERNRGHQHIRMYLGDVAFCANSVGFHWLSLLAYLCPQCVP